MAAITNSGPAVPVVVINWATPPATTIGTVNQGAAGASPWPVTATQSGAWSVSVAGSVAVTGTFFQATQPVSLASLPQPTGAGSLATGQATMGASAVQIVASRSGRAAVTIVNHSTTDVFLGNSGVTITTGVLLAGVKGAAVTLPASAAVFGITSGGTPTVSAVETF